MSEPIEMKPKHTHANLIEAMQCPDCKSWEPPAEHVKQATQSAAPRPVVDEEAEKGQPLELSIAKLLCHHCAMGSPRLTKEHMRPWHEGYLGSDDPEFCQAPMLEKIMLAVRTEAARAVWSEAADKCVDIAKAIVENHPDSIQFSAADGALACERAFRKLAAAAPAKEGKE